MELTNIINKLESHLLDTRQINRLAIRQARILSRHVIRENRVEEMRIVLLLCLAALHKGVPRADTVFLMKPFDPAIVGQHAKNIDAQPDWAELLIDPATFSGIKTLLENLVQNPDIFTPLSGTIPQPGADTMPLLISSRLSGHIGFSRYWCAAEKLENNLRSLLQRDLEEQHDRQRSENDFARKANDVLKWIFGKESILAGGGRFHHRQAAAAALALRTRFLIVSGGPGTGKTSVVIQILRALIRFFDPEIKPDRIVLCAPTGRAKARMGESVDKSIEEMEKISGEAGLSQGNPDLALKNLKCKTIHSLLGVRPDGGMKFNAQNPLPYQVIVVDEASMVDLSLFTGLIEAVSPNCRIILLGDMHQLPSVEAGAVLGDLTARFLSREGFPTLTEKTAEWVENVLHDVEIDNNAEERAGSLTLSSVEEVSKTGALIDHAVVLTHSYRSSEAHGILELCSCINRGKADEVIKVIQEGRYSNTLQMETENEKEEILRWLKSHYLGEHLKTLEGLKNLQTEAVAFNDHPDFVSVLSRLEAAFKILDGSRMLVFGHEGETGRDSINRQADKLLRTALDKNQKGRFFHGQLVILEQNHHDLDLYNGDWGIVVQSKNEGTKVIFRRGNGYKVQALGRLMGLEPAYAMTVHKSQGSEFDEVLLVLPGHETPLLSRQIVYTGITRARYRIKVLGSPAILKRAIAIQEERPGGVLLD